MAPKKAQKKVAKALPACEAILLCESVTRDRGTHKTDIKGIFDTFWLPSFPGPTLPCNIFLLLADAVGTYSITAEVHDPKRGLVLFRSSGAGSFGTRGKPMRGELWFPVGELIFDRPGTYEMVVFADGIELGRTGFKVTTK